MGSANCAQGKDEVLSNLAALPIATSSPLNRHRTPQQPQLRANATSPASSISSVSSSVEAYAVMRDVVRTAVQTNTTRGHSSSQGTTRSSSHQNRSLVVKKPHAVAAPNSIMVQSTPSPSASSQDPHRAPTSTAASIAIPSAAPPVTRGDALKGKGPRSWNVNSSGKKSEDALRQWLEAQASVVHLGGANDMA